MTESIDVTIDINGDALEGLDAMLERRVSQVGSDRLTGFLTLDLEYAPTVDLTSTATRNIRINANTTANELLALLIDLDEDLIAASLVARSSRNSAGAVGLNITFPYEVTVISLSISDASSLRGSNAGTMLRSVSNAFDPLSGSLSLVANEGTEGSIDISVDNSAADVSSIINAAFENIGDVEVDKTVENESTSVWIVRFNSLRFALADTETLLAIESQSLAGTEAAAFVTILDSGSSLPFFRVDYWVFLLLNFNGPQVTALQ